MYQITDILNYENHTFSSCIPLFWGMENCAKGHSYGPRTRDYILIHFILSGTGSVLVEDQEYKIVSNQAFIIPANVTCQYIAGKTDPWKYCWVAFYASPDLLPTLFSHSSDLYICEKINAQYIKNIFFKILAKHFAFQDHHRLEEEFSSSYLNLSANMDISFSFDLAAALYEILSYLSLQSRTEANEMERRLREIKNYIDCYYNKPLQIKKIADEFSIHPNYLISLFKKKYGISPKRYMLNKRLSVAYKLLETTDYPVKDIACLVGYKNQLEFSAMFKKMTGKSPLAYRNEFLSQEGDY